MLFLVQYGIPFKVPVPSFCSVCGTDQLVLCYGSHIANVVGLKIVVLKGHIGCSTICGSCMRLDVGPALMVSYQFRKLIKKHLVVCHKSGVFCDGAICLCDGMGALSIICSKGSSQSVPSPSLGVVSFLIM